MQINGRAPLNSIPSTGGEKKASSYLHSIEGQQNQFGIKKKKKLVDSSTLTHIPVYFCSQQPGPVLHLLILYQQPSTKLLYLLTFPFQRCGIFSREPLCPSLFLCNHLLKTSLILYPPDCQSFSLATIGLLLFLVQFDCLLFHNLITSFMSVSINSSKGGKTFLILIPLALNSASGI